MGSRLTAYVVGTKLQIVPASQHRAWMKEKGGGFAQRCLPLLIANQCGWSILNPSSFTATWDGGDERSAISIEPSDTAVRPGAVSHFGYGILTWHIPFLFQTSPGYQLWIKGPANSPKDGVSALEGIVETDWCAATFTMNWQMTRSEHAVTFEAGEPICVVVPQRVLDLEDVEPQITSIENAPEATRDGFRRFAAGRSSFLTDLRTDPGSTAWEQKWEKHYFQGRNADGSVATTHRTKLHLAPFSDELLA